MKITFGMVCVAYAIHNYGMEEETDADIRGAAQQLMAQKLRYA